MGINTEAMDLKVKNSSLYILLTITAFFAFNIETALAEDKDGKTWSIDVQKDYHSTAELTGRFKLYDYDWLMPYLITGGDLNWDTMPKPDEKEPNIKNIYRYDIGLNFGAGFSWNISKGVSLFAEPSLKYKIFEGLVNPTVEKKTDEKMDENLKFGIHYGF